MPESVRSSSSTQIPRIPEPVVLAWTPDLDDGDVAYIAGSPPPPAPPPPSMASESTASVNTVRGYPLPPPPPPPPSVVSQPNGHTDHWTSMVSLARATVGDGSNSRRVSMLSQATMLDAVVEEEPPGYVEARVPTYPVDYTFTQVEGDEQSMIVVPPPDAPDTHPVYHIRVTYDLFDPSFFITTVRKGGSSNGRVVGDFTTKPGCSALEETLFFKKSESHIFKRLVAGLKKDEFQWKLHGRDELLLWKWDKHWTVKCHHVPEQTVTKNKRYEIVAQFHPPVMRSPAQSTKVACITVQPSGQKFFDEVILSLLILERKRRKLATRRT